MDSAHALELPILHPVFEWSDRTVRCTIVGGGDGDDGGVFDGAREWGACLRPSVPDVTQPGQNQFIPGERWLADFDGVGKRSTMLCLNAGFWGYPKSFGGSLGKGIMSGRFLSKFFLWVIGWFCCPKDTVAQELLGIDLHPSRFDIPRLGLPTLACPAHSTTQLFQIIVN